MVQAHLLTRSTGLVNHGTEQAPAGSHAILSTSPMPSSPPARFANGHCQQGQPDDSPPSFIISPVASLAIGVHDAGVMNTAQP